MHVFAYWSGPVTWMERLSVATATANGHQVSVFSYKPDELRSAGLGVPVEDARAVLDSPELDGINERVPDHFSDWFRVEGLAKGLGTWADLDMVYLSPLGTESSLMAWETETSVCGAVLKLEPSSPVLRDYLAFCRKRPVTYAPPWYPLHTRLNMQWKRVEKWIARKPPPRLLYGPAALTNFVRSNGRAVDVLPKDTFYPFAPVTGESIRIFLDGTAVTEHFTPRTRAVHLWHNLFKRVNGLDPPPAGSWLGQQCRALDVL